MREFLLGVAFTTLVVALLVMSLGLYHAAGRASFVPVATPNCDFVVMSVRTNTPPMCKRI